MSSHEGSGFEITTDASDHGLRNCASCGHPLTPLDVDGFCEDCHDSTMLLPKPKKPHVDEKYREWIRQQRSVVSGRLNVECAHVRSRGARGGDKANVVPLTHTEHIRLHAWGQEPFEERYSVDLEAEAAEMWERYQKETDGAQ